MATQTTTRWASGHLLQLVMRTNAVVTATTGLVMLIGAAPLARFLGVAAPPAIAAVGMGLLLYIPVLLWMAGRTPQDRRMGLVAAALDGLWVAGSLALILTDMLPLTPEGRWLIGAVADVVLVFALAQLYAAWRMKGT
jgi:hypothetical protein